MDNINISNSTVTPVARNVVIDPKINEEYINFHDVCKEGELKINQLKAVREKLQKKDTNQQEKKQLLFRLAHTPNPRAYKIIQDFYFNSKGILQMWSALALEECQMFVQTELLTEVGSHQAAHDTTMVSTLGGGDGQRFRFWTVLTSKNSETISKKDRHDLQCIFDEHFYENNTILEKIDWSNNYCVVCALQSMDVAIDEIISPILKDAKDIFKFHYFTTNTNYPTKKEISDYLHFLEQNNIS